ncbi:MAG: class I SAM-dependent methyltransferase [Acidobacteriota bacterium]
MGGEKWSFDREAVAWDSNPGRVKVAGDIADAIAGEGILTTDKRVLDFGCGTGLLALRLQPLVRSITGVDSSRGMLDVFRAKIEERKLANVETLCLDVEKGDLLEGRFDVIVCGMTLHHVKNIGPLLNQFHRVMTPGGYLCIADLDTEDGQFHGENDSVFHLGFDRRDMERLLGEAGFDIIGCRTATAVAKSVADGSMRSFDIFLMTGRKNVPL